MSYRNASKIVIDTLAWTLTLPIAYFLRLDVALINNIHDVLLITLLSLPVKATIVWLNRHHDYSWRYAGVNDSVHLALSTFQFFLVFLIFSMVAKPYLLIPLSIPIIDLLLSIVLFTGTRAGAKVYQNLKKKNGHTRRGISAPKRKVLIAGAGDAGIYIVRSILNNSNSELEPVGFLDDDPQKKNQTIAGLKTLGAISDLPAVAAQTRASEVIIAIQNASGFKVREIVQLARKAKIKYRIIPSLNELLNRAPAINHVREVRIEDLLGRDSVELDSRSISNIITGCRVLVTGAGGSIGSEIVRQLMPFQPAEVIILGRGENSLHQLRLEVDRDYPHQKVTTCVCNIRDSLTLENIFQQYRPQVVFHSAAHKHVTLMEENPSQAVFNNVMGTRNVVNAALKHNVGYFVNISTDKAINPTSIMGACKRVTELIVQDAGKRAKANQYFTSVRFGNVLGSRGSVVPIFQEQIRRGGPVTVTHENVMRYFMTIPEASQLVLQAAALQMNGCVFVLKMGDPVRILDLANELIRLSGFEPGKDIHIVITGLQEGEKLYEELIYDDEHNTLTLHEKVLICETNGIPSNLDHLLKNLIEAAETYDGNEIRKTLKTIVPSYTGYKAKKQLLEAI
jgi:FlaA1/EpsC-like NDP-sugar epimerase